MGRGKQSSCLIMIKGKRFFFLVVSGKTNWGNEQGIQNKVGNNISMQNKLDMLFQPSRVIERPNHSLIEYSLLSQCNHKARLDGLKAYRLTWLPWLEAMERRFREGVGIDVGDKCLLEDSYRLFSHNGDQLILGDELESPMEGRHDCTYCMQLGPP